MHVQLVVGPASGPGEETFDLTVCDVAHLGARVDSEAVIDGRHVHVVEDFDWSSLRCHFSERVSRCEGDDWTEVARKVGRLGRWEFEDYTP